jgi:hypothetical protein
MQSAKLIQVIVTESCRGKGTEADVARIVTEYWSVDGEKLAENDPCPLTPKPATPPEHIRGLGRAEGVAAVTVALGGLAPAADWARAAREWLASADGKAAIETQVDRLDEKVGKLP